MTVKFGGGGGVGTTTYNKLFPYLQVSLKMFPAAPNQ